MKKQISIPEPQYCAGCRKPLDPERCIVHVGQLESGLTWHLTCFKLRECTTPMEMN